MGSGSGLLIVALCVFFFMARKLIVINRQRRAKRMFPECEEPQMYPHIEPFFGTDLLIKTARLIRQDRNLPALAQRHCKLGKTYVVNSLGQHVFHTIDPENFKAVYETRWTDWGVAPARLQAMEPFCGRGLINTDGDDWTYLRRLTAPCLSESSLIKLDSFGSTLEEYLDREIVIGEPVDLAPLFYRFFLDISGEFLVGERFEAISRHESPPVSPAKFLDAFHGALAWLTVRVYFGILGCALPNKNFDRNCSIVHCFLDHYVNLATDVRQNKDHIPSSKSRNGNNEALRFGMAGILAERAESSSIVRSQLLQSLMNMQETTATLVSNTVFLLSRHRNIWARLKDDVAHTDLLVLSSDKLESMPLLWNVLKESLRMYPVLATAGRTSLRDTVLPRGGGDDGLSPVFVPKNSRIITPYYGLHRDPQVFGEDVEVFRPDRWIDIRPKPWEYLPFGNGPRVCPGREKAMLEAAYVIARLRQKYEKIESRDDQEWRGQWALTVKNANGCKVALVS